MLFIYSSFHQNDIFTFCRPPCCYNLLQKGNALILHEKEEELPTKNLDTKRYKIDVKTQQDISRLSCSLE